jgi:hypothetical protein
MDINIFVVILRSVTESIARGINSLAEYIFYLDCAIALHSMHNDEKNKTNVLNLCCFSIAFIRLLLKNRAV